MFREVYCHWRCLEFHSLVFVWVGWTAAMDAQADAFAAFTACKGVRGQARNQRTAPPSYE